MPSSNNTNIVIKSRVVTSMRYVTAMLLQLSGLFIKLHIMMLFSAFSVYAGDVQFSASAPGVVAIGEQFRLTYSLNVRAGNIRLPDLGNFQLISGPSTSSSSSVQIINGQMTQTQSVTYTYVLRATEAGKYTIAPASVTVETDRYTSNPLEIEVVADSQGRSSAQAPASRGTSARPADISGEDIFIRIITDKNEVFQGEALVATIKIFTKLDLTGIENVRFPSFSGFYQQDIETPPLRALDREVIDGEIYGTGVLKRLILFPQRSGEINIEPFAMDALVRQRTGRRGSMFDEFFGGFETSRIPVNSPPLGIKVNPLPDQRPPGFNGAVGNFSLNAVIGQDEVQANEALTLSITISGNGNLRLLGKPGVDFPPAFEVYDPDIRENIRNSPGGQEGSITYEYLMIPRSAGNFRIPPVQFSFFNPETRSFRTLGSGEFNLLVHKSDETDSGVAATGFARENLRILGSDIRFIKTAGTLKSRDNDPFLSVRFYLWFILPLLIFVLLILSERKKIRDRANIALMRNRRASRMVKRRLRSAGKYLRDGNHHLFFEEMLRAQWGYLSDKLLIPVSELNREKAEHALLERNVSSEDTSGLMDLITRCEFSRYSPSPDSTDMDRLYRDTIKIVTSIEQSIRQ